MTVKELIEKLSALQNGEAVVFFGAGTTSGEAVIAVDYIGSLDIVELS